jgi:hypothetical protein
MTFQLQLFQSMAIKELENLFCSTSFFFFSVLKTKLIGALMVKKNWMASLGEEDQQDKRSEFGYGQNHSF